MNELPITETDCDARLVKVAALYVLERGMPLQFALELLMDRLKDRTEISQRITEFLKYVTNGNAPI